MRAGGDSCLASAQPPRAAAHVSAQPGLPLRCLHAGVLFASAEACMLLQKNMTRPVALPTLIVHVLWTLVVHVLWKRKCFWGMLLGLSCDVQQKLIHVEGDAPTYELLKDNVQMHKHIE